MMAALRKRFGDIPVVQLAHKAKIAQSSLSNWDANKGSVGLDTLIRVSVATRTPIDALLPPRLAVNAAVRPECDQDWPALAALRADNPALYAVMLREGQAALEARGGTPPAPRPEPRALDDEVAAELRQRLAELIDRQYRGKPAALATAAGVPPTELQALLDGERRLALATVVALAQAADCSAGWLLGEPPAPLATVPPADDDLHWCVELRELAPDVYDSLKVAGETALEKAQQAADPQAAASAATRAGPAGSHRQG